jgi:hypothetical protein
VLGLIERFKGKVLIRKGARKHFFMFFRDFYFLKKIGHFFRARIEKFEILTSKMLTRKDAPALQAKMHLKKTPYPY